MKPSVRAPAESVSLWRPSRPVVPDLLRIWMPGQNRERAVKLLGQHDAG